MYTAKIQIRFSDCDMLKHVNNAIYLQYFEVARMQFMNHELPNWDWTKKGIILAKNTINYIKPLFLSDDCNIEVFCSKVGTTSFTLGYDVIVNDSKKRILKLTGESVLVCYDYIHNSTMQIPQDLLKILENNFRTL